MATKRSKGASTGRDGGRDRLLKPGEVAGIFDVDPKTVTRWHKNGKIPASFTPGGHRRFRRSDVEAFLETVPGQQESATQAAA